MHHGSRWTAVALATLACSLSLPASAQGRPDLVAASLNDPGRAHVAGEVLVQFRRGATDDQKAAALHGVGGRIHDDVRMGHERQDGKGDLHLVKLPPGLAIAAAVRDLERDAGVEFAEPNWIYRHEATSNDTYFVNGSLWGMYGSPKNQYGSQAAAAWTTHTCNESVYVGVIDEGIMTSHPDLIANVWTNPFDPVDGIDNDGNGYVDDVHGYDFAGNDNSVFDGVNDDHGTHVAGTIGAKGGNGVGVVGVCWTVRLIIAKFLGNHGGTTANAIRAVDYLTDLKTRHGLNIVATNNSWGGGGYSQALADAIKRSGDANILFVAAAGNSSANNDRTPHYPSSYGNANILSVASITSSGSLSSFSNYGATTVDLGAPGSGIWSTVPVRSKGNTVAGYASYSGTSMATPHVTGSVALYASTRQGATVADIRDAILSSALPTSSLSGKTVTGARLNAGGF